MNAVHVLLAAGTFFLALFTFIFVSGAMVQLVRLATEALGLAAKPARFGSDAVAPAPMARPTVMA